MAKALLVVFLLNALNVLADRPAVLPSYPEQWQGANGEFFYELPIPTAGISLAFHSAGDGSWNSGFGGYGKRFGLVSDSAIVVQGTDLNILSGAGSKKIYHPISAGSQTWRPERWPAAGDEVISLDQDGYKVVFPTDGISIRYVSDPVSGWFRVSTIKDQFGNTTIIERSDSDPSVITKITLPFDQIINFTVTNGLVKKITDPDGVEYNLQFDNADRLTSVTGSGSYKLFEWSLDGSHRIVAIGNETGKTNQFEYNSDGSIKFVTDTYGNVSSFRYFADHIELWSKAKTYDVYWDAQGNISKTSSEAGDVNYSWDEYHRLLKVDETTDILASVQMQYDPAVNGVVSPAKSISSFGIFSNIVYDQTNWQTLSITTNGRRTEYTYTQIGDFIFLNSIKRGQATVVIERDGTTGAYVSSSFQGIKTDWIVSRDDNGRVVETGDIRGNKTTYSYDGAKLSSVVENGVTTITESSVTQVSTAPISPIYSGQPSTWPKTPLSNEWKSSNQGAPLVPAGYSPANAAKAMLNPLKISENEPSADDSLTTSLVSTYDKVQQTSGGYTTMQTQKFTQNSPNQSTQVSTQTIDGQTFTNTTNTTKDQKGGQQTTTQTTVQGANGASTNSSTSYSGPTCGCDSGCSCCGRTKNQGSQTTTACDSDKQNPYDTTGNNPCLCSPSDPICNACASGVAELICLCEKDPADPNWHVANPEVCYCGVDHAGGQQKVLDDSNGCMALGSQVIPQQLQDFFSNGVGQAGTQLRPGFQGCNRWS